MERQSGRKEKKRVVYSNHNYVTTRRVVNRTVQLQESHPFEASFSLYLRFWLARKFPFSGVLLMPEQKSVLSTADAFAQLQAMMDEELRQWNFKIILIKTSMEVDTLNDKLDSGYGACFFSREQVDKALVELSECQVFREEAEALRGKIRMENVGFLRVLREREQECLEDIYEILEQHAHFNSSISDVSMLSESSSMQKEDSHDFQSSFLSTSDVDESFKTEISDGMSGEGV